MVSLLALTTWLFLSTTATALQDCFYYDGATTPNNSVCAGSDSCCGPTATCESYRLCHNQGDPPNVFVRGPCAVYPWDTSVCPQICLYSKSVHWDTGAWVLRLIFHVDETTGVFPRVYQCPDQSWCCSNTTGTAVADSVQNCCNNGGGVFMDALGYIISTSTSASQSPTQISTTSALTTKAATTTPASSSTSAPSTQSGLSTGSKVGIGVGVGVGALIIGAVVGFLVYRRRSKRSKESNEKAWQPPQYDARPHYGKDAQYWQPSEAASTPLVEMPHPEASSKPLVFGASSGAELGGSSPTTGINAHSGLFEMAGGSRTGT